MGDLEIKHFANLKKIVHVVPKTPIRALLVT